MWATVPPGLLMPPARLVPVPLHPSRLRRRGFNQAERLARGLARRSGLIVHDCLTRAGPATRQVGRDRADRLEAPGRIRLAPESTPPPAAVLVDDVATTGGTLAACAAALHGAGVQQVGAVAYARTPGR
jgi:predicted amidophosphoribosyltransferase